MSLDDKYLDLSEEEIDNLLYGLDLDKKLDQNNSEKCISCKSYNLVIDNAKGYLVCKDCGVINEEFLDKNHEFNNDINGTTRYGCPSNFFYPKSALGTKITSKSFNRLSAIQRQGQMPYKEKSLMEVLERIQLKCKKYNITQTIIDTSKILYKKVSECGRDDECSRDDDECGRDDDECGRDDDECGGGDGNRVDADGLKLI